MDWLHQQLVANKQKAVAALVVAGLTALASNHGINLDKVTGTQLVQAVVYGVIGFVAVFYKKNQ